MGSQMKPRIAASTLLKWLFKLSQRDWLSAAGPHRQSNFILYDRLQIPDNGPLPCTKVTHAVVQALLIYASDLTIVYYRGSTTTVPYDPSLSLSRNSCDNNDMTSWQVIVSNSATYTDVGHRSLNPFEAKALLGPPS